MLPSWKQALILAALASAPALRADPLCPKLMIAAGPYLVPDLVPEAVFERAGISPSEVEFRIIDDGVSFQLTASRNQKFIGYIIVTEVVDEGTTTYPIVDKVEIHNDFKGKGLGTFFYLAAARLKYDLSRKPLQISQITTDEAKAVWKRFNAMGYAETHDSMYGETQMLRPDVLKSKIGTNAWNFVADRLVR